MVLGIRILLRTLPVGLTLFALSVAADVDGSLKVCLLEDNLPYSSRQAKTGFDYDVGKLLAEQLELDFDPVWVANSTQILEIEGDYPFRRLARGDCSLILSVPGPAKSIDEAGTAISLGSPYYGAAFELLTRGSETATTIRSLDKQNVAIMSQTVAHFALRKIGANPTTYFSVNEALRGLLNGEADAGLLWGPTAGWLIQENNHFSGQIRIVENLPPAALSWNIHFATRSEDESLRKKVSDALAEMNATAELSRLMSTYRFPNRQPFEVTHSLSAFNDL